jgi:hypothetical protein
VVAGPDRVRGDSGQRTPHAPTTGLLAANLDHRFESFMDPTVRELPKDEKIVLPDIRFLTQDELHALRANAEELKKKFEQDSWTKTR